ncbi:hypothetical protein VNO80_21432 [Phaseolus coccineus]|uniref:Uncharacterized protein n=1 Tax=Phaseolus coccineus TaxID=3886 RepID=A0AAN9QXQ6_PHACN
MLMREVMCESEYPFGIVHVVRLLLKEKGRFVILHFDVLDSNMPRVGTLTLFYWVPSIFLIEGSGNQMAPIKFQYWAFSELHVLG